MSRLVLRFTLGLLFVLVAIFLVVGHAARQVSQEHFKRHVGSLLTDVQLARQELGRTPPERAKEVLAALKKRLTHPVALLDPPHDDLPEAAREALAKDEPRTTHSRGKGWALFVPVHLAGDKAPRLLKVGPGGPPRLTEHSHVWLVGLGLLLVVIGTGVVLAWPLVRRLQRLERTADRISAGELGARADVAAKDAVGRLASRFNAMADRVQALLEQQRGLLEAVSHELRTPVARLRFGLEMLSGSEDAEDRARRLEAIAGDLDELEALVGEILLYIRTGEEALGQRPEPVDPAPLARALAARLGELHPSIAVRIDLPDDQGAEGSEASDGRQPPGGGLLVTADPKLLGRALGNVLDNALRHARSEVVISAAAVRGGAELRVDDDGPGIPEAERTRVFEPFVRLDESRSRQTGGAGLGLALVRRILEAHGGEARVEASPLGGTRLVLRFPEPGAAVARNADAVARNADAVARNAKQPK